MDKIKKQTLVLLVLLGFIFVLFYSLTNFKLTTFAIETNKKIYFPNEELGGKYMLDIKKGELWPLDSKVIVSLGDIKREYSLKEWLDKSRIDYKVYYGNFYVDGKKVDGFGAGFGFIGEVEKKPKIKLKIKVVSKEEEKGKEGTEVVNITNITIINASNITNITEEKTKEKDKESEVKEEEKTTVPGVKLPKKIKYPIIDKDIKDKESEVKEEEKTKEEKGEITKYTGPLSFFYVLKNIRNKFVGYVVKEKEIDTEISVDKPFVYPLKGNEKIEVSSVNIETEEKTTVGKKKEGKTEIVKGEGGLIKIEKTKNYVKIYTLYEKKKKGFGEEFISEPEKIGLSLDSLGLKVPEKEGIYDFSIEIVYNGEVLAKERRKIAVIKGLVNETEKNKTNQTFNQTFNYTFNFTNNLTNLSLGNLSNITQPTNITNLTEIFSIKILDETGKLLNEFKITKAKKERLKLKFSRAQSLEIEKEIEGNTKENETNYEFNKNKSEVEKLVKEKKEGAFQLFGMSIIPLVNAQGTKNDVPINPNDLSKCGNNVCDQNEDTLSCPSDCPFTMQGYLKGNLTLQYVRPSQVHKKQGINTEILAVKTSGLMFENLIVRLDKIDNRKTKQILRCGRWDINNQQCLDSFVPVSVPFKDYQSYIILNLTSFSAYAGGSGVNASLLIYDTSDLREVGINDNLTFYANYTIYNTTTPLSDKYGNCEISINGRAHAMYFDALSNIWKYNYMTSEEDVGINKYTVSCSSSYGNLTVSDSFNVSNFNAINYCQTINKQGTYKLVSNLSMSNLSIPNCLAISSSNVVLDCAGNSINSTQNSNALYVGFGKNAIKNVTIKNCYFSGAKGILFNAINSEITNNVFDIVGDYAINLINSNNNNIKNNEIKFNGIDKDAIIINASNNNIILNNIIHLANGNGINFINSFNNKIKHTNILLVTSKQNKVAAVSALKFTNSNNNTIESSVLESTLNSVFVAGHGNNSLVNVSFDKNLVGFERNARGSIYVKWFVDAKVQRKGTALSNASLTIKDSTNKTVAYENTLADGFIKRKILTEKIINANKETSLNPYYFYAKYGNLIGYIYANITSNMLRDNGGNVVVDIQPLATIVSCGEIKNSGYYEMTSDIIADKSPCIVLNASNIELNCMDYRITNASSGIYVKGGEVKIYNCSVEASNKSVVVENGNNVNISKNKLYGEVEIDNTNNLALVGNSISSLNAISLGCYGNRASNIINIKVAGNQINASKSLRACKGSNIEISNNTISSDNTAIELKNVYSVKVDNNTIIGKGVGYGIYSESDNSIVLYANRIKNFARGIYGNIGVTHNMINLTENIVCKNNEADIYFNRMYSSFGNYCDKPVNYHDVNAEKCKARTNLSINNVEFYAEKLKPSVFSGVKFSSSYIPEFNFKVFVISDIPVYGNLYSKYNWGDNWSVNYGATSCSPLLGYRTLPPRSELKCGTEGYYEYPRFLHSLGLGYWDNQTNNDIARGEKCKIVPKQLGTPIVFSDGFPYVSCSNNSIAPIEFYKIKLNNFCNEVETPVYVRHTIKLKKPADSTKTSMNMLPITTDIESSVGGFVFAKKMNNNMYRMAILNRKAENFKKRIGAIKKARFIKNASEIATADISALVSSKASREKFTKKHLIRYFSYWDPEKQAYVGHPSSALTNIAVRDFPLYTYGAYFVDVTDNLTFTQFGKLPRPASYEFKGKYRPEIQTWFGYNIIVIPLTTTMKSAKDLCNAINDNGATIWKWDVELQKFKKASQWRCMRIKYGIGNFAIHPGDVYRLELSQGLQNMTFIPT